MNFVDAILQMTTNRNKVFVMSFKFEAGNLTTLVHSVLLNAGKCVKMMENLWKILFIFAKDV
jgi:hypothetical protein